MAGVKWMDVKTKKDIREKVKRKPAGGKDRMWIVSYIVLVAVCVAIYFLLQFRVFGLLGTYRSLLQRLALAGILVSIVFIVTKTVEKIVTRRSQTKKISYNIIRLIRLLSVFIAIFIVITFLFAKWYTAAVSLGLFPLYSVSHYKHRSPHSLAGFILLFELRIESAIASR